MIYKHILLITFLNNTKIILLHAVNSFQVYIYTNYLILTILSYIYQKLNDFKYCYLTQYH